MAHRRTSDSSRLARAQKARAIAEASAGSRSCRCNPKRSPGDRVLLPSRRRNSRRAPSYTELPSGPESLAMPLLLLSKRGLAPAFPADIGDRVSPGHPHKLSSGTGVSIALAAVPRRLLAAPSTLASSARGVSAVSPPLQWPSSALVKARAVAIAEAPPSRSRCRACRAAARMRCRRTAAAVARAASAWAWASARRRASASASSCCAGSRRGRRGREGEERSGEDGGRMQEDMKGIQQSGCDWPKSLPLWVASTSMHDLFT